MYIKRLLDTKISKGESSRLMIHPAFIVLKSELQVIEDADFSFSTKGNMSTAFARYPECLASECAENPSNYGIGINFKSEKGLKGLIDFLSGL